MVSREVWAPGAGGGHNRVFRGEHIFFFGITVPFATPWEICPDIRTYLCAVALLTTPVRSLVAPAARVHAPRSRGHLAAAPAGPISSKHSRSWWPLPTCAHPCVKILTVSLDHFVSWLFFSAPLACAHTLPCCTARILSSVKNSIPGTVICPLQLGESPRLFTL